MSFDHENGQSVRQFLFHHTIRQSERCRKEQAEVETEAGGENEEKHRET